MSEQIENTGKEERSIKRFRIPLRIIAAVLAAAVVMVLLIHYLSSPYDRTELTYSNIIVERGDDIGSVAEKLRDEGIIKSPERFKLLSRLMLAGKLKPGKYFLSPSMDSVSILKTMQNGITTTDGFTIPAGYTVEQVAAALDRDGFADEEEFMRLADSFDFSEIDFIGNDVKGEGQLEGFLFPDEYSIDHNADEIMIIITMLNQFGNFFNDDYKARADELGLSVRQIVVIASMIEKETAVDKEKADISAVIHNRVNMDLMDADDFPELPLCSPGRESIIAALYPNDNEYTHYVLSDKLDGTHVFTSDDEEYDTLLAAYEEALKQKEEAASAGRDADQDTDADADAADKKQAE